MQFKHSTHFVRYRTLLCKLPYLLMRLRYQHTDTIYYITSRDNNDSMPPLRRILKRENGHAYRRRYGNNI